jgi:hypothetical protein
MTFTTDRWMSPRLFLLIRPISSLELQWHNLELCVDDPAIKLSWELYITKDNWRAADYLFIPLSTRQSFFLLVILRFVSLSFSVAPVTLQIFGLVCKSTPIFVPWISIRTLQISISNVDISIMITSVSSLNLWIDLCPLNHYCCCCQYNHHQSSPSYGPALTVSFYLLSLVSLFLTSLSSLLLSCSDGACHLRITVSFYFSAYP